MTENTPLHAALRTIATEGEGLQALAEALQGPLGSSFTKAIEKILAAPGRVIVSGMGKSGHIGRKIAATLASTGTPAYFVHPSEASHGDLGMIQSDDVIIAMSWSGESAELADIIAYANRFNVPLIAFTSNAESALGKGAHICLELPRAKEACPNGLAPTTSRTFSPSATTSGPIPSPGITASLYVLINLSLYLSLQSDCANKFCASLFLDL